MGSNSSSSDFDPEQVRHIQEMFGMNTDEVHTYLTNIQKARDQMGCLISMWSNGMSAAAAGDIDFAVQLSEMAAEFVARLEPDSLRWIVALATKAIAQKLRSESEMADVDPVAAAEEILKTTGGTGG